MFREDGLVLLFCISILSTELEHSYACLSSTSAHNTSIQLTLERHDLPEQRDFSIMPSIQGVAVFITSPQGNDLPLYRPDAKITDFARDPKSFTKYVEAVPRAKFCIQLAVNSNYDFGRYRALAFDITVDGKRCHRQILTKEEYESGPKPWFTEVSEYTRRDQDGSASVCNLEFTRPSFFKEAKSDRYAESGARQVCTVRIEVWPGKVDGHGDFKRGMDAEALATFLFLYRTRRQIDDEDLDPYEFGGTWASTLNRPIRSAAAGSATSPRRRKPSEEGEIVEGDHFEENANDARGLTPANGMCDDPDDPIPSIERDNGDWVDIGLSGRNRENQFGDPEDEDFDIVSSDGRDQEHLPNRARNPRRGLLDGDDDDDDDSSYHPSAGSSRQKRRRDSTELGRHFIPGSPALKRQRSVSVKPEQGNGNSVPPPLDPMAELARRRAELLKPFNRRYRELSPMEDGEHEVVKAKFEKRARIREEEKSLKRYFAREDRERRAAAAAERPNRWPGVNLINLTEDLSDEE